MATAEVSDAKTYQFVISKQIEKIKTNLSNALLELENADNPEDAGVASFFLAIIPYEDALAGYIAWRDLTRCGDPSSMKSFQNFIRLTVSNRTVKIIKRTQNDKVFYQARVEGNPTNGWDEDTILNILNDLHDHVELEEPIEIETIRNLLNDRARNFVDLDTIQNALNRYLIKERKIRIRFDSSISLDEIMTSVHVQ
ncbi:MAG: hypothetical protein WCJ25_00240 [Candidatus Moraniibacteriota bacterium]